MGQIEIMYLSQADIVEMEIGMAKVIELIERGFNEHGRGRVENPPKPGIHATTSTFIHAMPAYFKDLGIGGIKWVSGYPDNRARSMPQIIGTLILNDMETGAPVCIMDGTWITGVRTAAVSAVTAKYCACEDSSVLGVVGAGVQGHYNLIALKEVLPGLTKVKILDINRAAAENYQSEFGSKMGVDVTICDDEETVARGSDIIITATQRLAKPLIRDEWFEEGCLGMGLEASRAWYGDAILKSDKFITDDWEQTKSFHSQGAFPDGLPTNYTELGTIVAGQNKGRESADERIIAINIGLAFEDIILANHIYEMATKMGSYKKLTLMEW